MRSIRPFTPDPRWRRVFFVWLFSVQAITSVTVLALASNDIHVDLVELHSHRPPRRLVLTLLTSILALILLLLETALFLYASLHPIFVIASNTALAFLWAGVVVYQKNALDNLGDILKRLCPQKWKGRWIWCQNPKMELAFSVFAVICCVAVVIFAGKTYWTERKRPPRWMRALPLRGVWGTEFEDEDREGLMDEEEGEDFREEAPVPAAR